MATSTIDKTKGKVGLEKQDKVVMGKGSEQQSEDEQWEFIRDEVEKDERGKRYCSKRATGTQNRAREN